ncbi:MAG: MFS transporter [Chloroflexi bacterium]|nr:MFS transporter [Chloroflexota bacterium]
MNSSIAASGSWRRNLGAVFIAELLVIAGLSFGDPFTSLFVESLGSYTIREASTWAGIATGVGGISMFFSAPMWGILADRWGRKPMLLRSMLGTAVVVGLMGFSPNVAAFIGLRLAHGALAGTVAAASALVSSMMPRGRLPFAMGLLMTAVYVGNSVGPLFGGLAADNFGYQAAFLIAGGLLLAGGLVVLFLVHENFVRPPKRERASMGSMLRYATSLRILPLLVIQFALQAGPKIIAPIVPLFMEELDPSGAAATSAGIAFAISGVVAAASASAAGLLGERVTLKKILVVSCLFTFVAYLPPVWATTVSQLILYIALRGIANGGMMMSSYAMLSLSALPSEQGIAFGVGQSANALGNSLGPVLGGALGASLGFNYVFAFAAALYLLSALLVMKTLPKRAAGERG